MLYLWLERKECKEGGDSISANVISIDKYKNKKSKNSKDASENILDFLEINFDKEELFIKLKEEKRKEKDLDGLEE